MMNKLFTHDWLARPIGCTALVLGLAFGQVASAATINLTVEQSGTTGPGLAGTATVSSVTGFRYLVEEDTTHKPDLNVPSALKNSLAFEFHKSHNPVATDAGGIGISGTSTGSTATIVVPDNKNYFISIVPFNDGAVGGGAVTMGAVDVDTTIRVNSFPIPTAQISIRVFEDNNPVNGAIDIDERFISHSYVNGQKVPFAIKLFDPAGQYGAAGGRINMDAYGNPLGTEYGIAGNITSLPADTGINGFVLTPDDNGYIVVKNLPPAKYGVEITPPVGPDADTPMWVQTSTIEGTRTIDAWVKANEPEVFVEFGPPGPHVFVGFIRNYDCMNGDTGIDHEFDGLNEQGQPARLTDEACFGEVPVASGATITGQIVDNHMARSPSFQFSNGSPFEGCRVAVNRGIQGKTIFSGPCGADGTFEINNLESGTVLAPASYSLSIWDDGLDAVIANHPFTVVGAGTGTDPFVVSALMLPTGGTPPTTGQQAVNICTATGCDMGQIPVFNWFHKVDTIVFYDGNENGYRDCDASNLAGLTAADEDYCKLSGDDVTLHADSSATNLRFRDGRIYKSVPIDVDGAAPHEEVFPFFHWLVAEVDFATFKATGATFITDNGGSDGNLGDNGYVPQPQTVAACIGDAHTNGTTDGIPDGSDDADVGDGCTHDGGLSRTETGAVLTQAFQGFLGQKNVMEFGKTSYGPGENGGISGMAIYAITRAEDDPRYAAAEEWEPGIPRVQIALFQDSNDINGVAIAGGDTIIDDVNGSGSIELPDVDNHPLGWNDGTGVKGNEDIDRNNDGIFDMGDATEVTWTDSWDDSTPTNCGGSNGIGFLDIDTKCFDGLRNWNQVRPGVFDGGYAFSENMASGYYIVKSFTPPGYHPLTEDAKNVDFGDEYAVPQLLPPICVGDDYEVPALLAHVTDDDGITPVVTDAADFPSPYAGDQIAGSGDERPLCDTKQVRVAQGKNAAADFHYFTQVPKAAHVVGGVINDVANEFNQNSPTFGEKFTPPWLPVAFYDYKGHEVTRVYTDQFGKYNAMLPSTNTVSIASPSGVSPNMLTACMNDSGLVDDGAGNLITDPQHNPQYSQFCYTFQYMPGGTTYLDTPVVSIAAFAGSGFQLDCDASDETPLVASVSSAGYAAGAYVNALALANPDDAVRTLTINSVGMRSVPNPASTELSTLTQRNIIRDFGFGGAAGTVELIDENGLPSTMSLVGTGWTDGVITAAVPQGIAHGRYQLVVTRAAALGGLQSPMAVTVTVGALTFNGQVREVFPSPTAGATPIQDALDASAATLGGRGDLILVAPGTYDELPVMYQPVALQGSGAYSTFINARSVPAEKVTNWRAKVEDLLVAPTKFDLINGQIAGGVFSTEEGPGLLVVSKSAGATKFTNGRHSRIDGFSITGASTGGGVFINGHVAGFEISNNLITGNQGTFGGGIRLGHNEIKEQVIGTNVLQHPDANIRNVQIHHNMITRNGNFNGAGGGISIYTGSNGYDIEDNLICGNFAQTDGAGIGHLGLSPGGQINDNKIIFNQSFRQTPGFETDGGGILIAGAVPFAGGPTRTAGSGGVQINRNLIQGNQAGAGDGAGIALRRVNGQDVEEFPGDHTEWWPINIRNNTIVNNVAGYGGGAISMLDALKVNIINNTIANNESTATAGAAFTAPSVSDLQVAGIVSRANDEVAGLSTATPAFRYQAGFSHAAIRNNIIYQNRSRIYDLNALPVLTGNLIDPLACGVPCYFDLSANLAAANSLTRWNLLTDNSGTHTTNIPGDPGFIESYTNGNPGVNPAQAEFQTIMVAPALDEGGNWLDVRYAPLSINDVDGLDNNTDVASDYHISAGSPAENAGHPSHNRPLSLDIDLEPQNGLLDHGSDEVNP